MTGGRLIIPALRAREERFDHEAATIETARRIGAGGFIVFGGTAESVAALTGSIQSRFDYPLLFGADLERGAGQQFRGLTPFPPPRALAALDDPRVIAEAAAITAREARRVGINWIFAPVADLDLLAANPIVQTRAFGADPARVAERVARWIGACQAEGVPASVKHFPGHGRTVHDSHGTLPVVQASRDTLQDDLAPFRSAVAAGVASVMTAHVAFPALDPSGLPATRSRTILDLLRTDLGFEGAVVTDALMMAGATAGTTEAAAAREIVDAGVDILLYPSDIEGVAGALAAGVRESPAFAARVADALRRRERLIEHIGPPPEAPTPLSHEATAEGMAARLVEAGLVRGAVPRLRLPIALRIVDDDLDGDWPVSSRSAIVGEALEAQGLPVGTGGSRVVLAFCEARAGKRRGGFSAASLAALGDGDADLVVLFGHERLAEVIPGEAPVLVAWHRQPLMQRAAADLLRRWTG